MFFKLSTRESPPDPGLGAGWELTVYFLCVGGGQTEAVDGRDPVFEAKRKGFRAVKMELAGNL